MVRSLTIMSLIIRSLIVRCHPKLCGSESRPLTVHVNTDAPSPFPQQNTDKKPLKLHHFPAKYA